MDPLRLLADQRCVACAARGAVLCRPCRRALPWLRGPLCPRCGEPDACARLACPLCGRLGRAVGSVRSALLLTGGGASLVRAWKDGACAPVAAVAADCVRAVVPVPPADLIVPVPAARARADWRGVDGPRTLAGLLGRVWEVPVRGTALIRLCERPQRGLSAGERRRNAASAFAARERVAGRVLLVDDVLTTGATVRAAARHLRAAGAERVDVVTLARVATIV